ncbi:hypothetical protein [Streptomyces sp. JJ36]|uniref:Rv1733c family protein n=1 Tax=Streptomyces sp. JJ36 TaxID=2736645 RepID=UPI001F2B1DB4|nr:hypothetical protein [Streptomyces sp. JJ36]MCF6525357.1 hypothetical protein [Streptomyces sp. JJ36]
MASQPGAPMWRWRANPLRRRSDVVEAWVLLAALLLAGVGAVCAGVLAGKAVQSAAETQREQRQRVRAVVPEGSLPEPGNPAREERRRASGGDDTLPATLRWTAPDGTTQQGTVRVPADVAAGDTVPLWVDEEGRRTAAPPGPALTAFHAVLAGLLAAGGLTAVVLGLQRAARGVLDRHRLRQWERAWEEVEPHWRPRTP